MVIDEQGDADQGSDGSDIDAVSHFTEKFDEETVGDTEMAVSFFVFIYGFMHFRNGFMHFKTPFPNIRVQGFTGNRLLFISLLLFWLGQLVRITWSPACSVFCCSMLGTHNNYI